MAELSPAEKAAGRWFRDNLAIPAMEKHLSALGEAVQVPPYLRHIRHECQARPGHTTWAVECREWYVLSPVMGVQGSSVVDIGLADDEAGEVTIIPAGFFCWLWKGGACSCGYSVRSGAGRMVVRAAREPLRGAAEIRLDTT